MKALSIFKEIEIIAKNQFVVVAPDADDEIYVIYIVAIVKMTIIPIYFFYEAQVTLVISI